MISGLTKLCAVYRVGIPNFLSRFGQPPVSSGRVVILTLPSPHPTQPHQPSAAMRHSTPLRSPRGTFRSLGFAHPWGTSGRQRLRPRHGRRLLRRTGTASSTSAASWARCCCATTPAPRSWPRAGASAAGTRPAQRRYLLGGYYVDAHGRGLVVGFLMLLLLPARSYPESAGYAVAEIGWFLPLSCVLLHHLPSSPGPVEVFTMPS